MESFGIRLKRLIDASPFTQKELANKIGVNKSLITMYISGGANPTSEKIIKFAKIFNVSTDFLLLGKEPEHPDVKKYRQIAEELHAASARLRDAGEKIDDLEIQELLDLLKNGRTTGVDLKQYIDFIKAAVSKDETKIAEALNRFPENIKSKIKENVLKNLLKEK